MTEETNTNTTNYNSLTTEQKEAVDWQVNATFEMLDIMKGSNSEKEEAFSKANNNKDAWENEQKESIANSPRMLKYVEKEFVEAKKRAGGMFVG